MRPGASARLEARFCAWAPLTPTAKRGARHVQNEAAGLPVQVFTVLTNHTPMFLTAFCVGWIAYRVLGGFRVPLFVALASPWLLVGGYGCLELADDSLRTAGIIPTPSRSCWGRVWCRQDCSWLLSRRAHRALTCQLTRTPKNARRLRRQLLLGAG